MASLLIEAVRDFCLNHGWARTYWVAYSGGLDSQVLLSICAKLRSDYPIQLKVIHVNHGLSPNAKTWAKACANQAAIYDLPYFEHETVLAVPSGASLEEAARTMRYQVFSALMAPDDVLLTAHQQDDQAETVLLQLFRGTGLKGLAAMPAIKSLGQGWHGRPLLAFSRAQLQSYAKENDLSWVDDESNLNNSYSRNFLRNRLMPLIKERWPGASSVISRAASHCAEADYLLEQWGRSALIQSKGSEKNALSVKKLLMQDPISQRWVLRTWMKDQGYLLVDTAKLHAIQETVLMAKLDRFPRVVFQQNEIRRYRDNLYIMPCLSDHDPNKRYAWDLLTPLTVEGIGTLVASKFKSQRVVVGFRQGGERLSLPNRSGSHTLKNLFQEWHIPTWERDRIPLIFVDEKLIGVVGYFMEEGYDIRRQ